MSRHPPTKIVDNVPFEYADTPEGRISQMGNLAYKCVIARLRDGTASPNEVVACLRLASEREKLNQEKIKAESLLAKAKVDALESQRKQEELYQEAINAFKGYAGSNG